MLLNSTQIEHKYELSGPQQFQHFTHLIQMVFHARISEKEL